MDEQKLNGMQIFLMAYGASFENPPNARVTQLSKAYDALLRFGNNIYKKQNRLPAIVR